MHSDKRVVKPGETYHVTIHVHVREKRDRLDELVLPTFTNAINLGDERRRTPAPDGTDFYETLTVESDTAGTASFSPAYIDAIDPQTGTGMRYSSQPLNVRVSGSTAVSEADPDTVWNVLRTLGLTVLAIVIALIVAIVLFVRFVTKRPARRAMPPAAAADPPRVRVIPADPLADALATYRARGDDAALDALRVVMFTLAGAGPGATFADALRALGSRDPELGRAMAVAERARFGPLHDRPPASRDLVALLDAYIQNRETVV